MQFPNLLFAISLNRLPHYAVAQATGISESRFSRLLNGRSEPTQPERARIASVLGYPEKWLFARPTPPERNENGELVHAGSSA
jgi:transcriptional regulator with XRE-family HTH domain